MPNSNNKLINVLANTSMDYKNKNYYGALYAA